MSKKRETKNTVIVKGKPQTSQKTIIVKGSQKNDKNPQLAKAHIPPQNISTKYKMNKYKLFLKDQEPLEQKSFFRKDVTHYTQKIREEWDENLESKLREERELFVELLFKERQIQR